MPPAHDVLLDAAERLFYDDGITATGVDAVVRAAGVTKPTLYAHFGSKSDLVAAVLQRRFDERRAELEAWLEPVPAAGHASAVLDWLEHFYVDRGDRGCGFLNAAAELSARDPAARAVVEAEKAWLRDVLVRGCAAYGSRRPEVVGSQLLLLVDGVAGRAVVGGREAAHAAAAEARQAAEVLLDASR
ncbi:MAG: TetR/AcrR family transcriptional regulator [Janthinobacterium lividum]